MHTIDNILKALDTLDDNEKRQYARRLHHKSEIGIHTFPCDVDVYDRTNALATAIANANADVVEKLLTYWDKDSLNDPNSLVLGYRELYSFFHLAFDPNGQDGVNPIDLQSLTEPFHIEILTKKGESVKQNLIKIIRLLAQHGADPNLQPVLTTHRAVYKNPAMAGGRGRGYGYLPEAILIPLTVEWVLAGGKPESGTWFSLTKGMSGEIDALVEVARLQSDVSPVASSVDAMPTAYAPTGLTCQSGLFGISSSASSTSPTHPHVGTSSTSTSPSEPSTSTPISLFSETDFICPIIHEAMKDPVIAADGYSYERSAIEDWFAKKGTSPMTNLRLTSLALIPNRDLQRVIEKWQSTQPSQSNASLPTPGSK